MVRGFDPRERRLGRRGLLKIGVALAALPLLQACGGSAPASPSTPPAPSSAPAAAPTTASAAPAPAPTAAAASAPAAGAAVTLAFWQIGGKPWQDFFDQTMHPGFYKQYPNIKIEQTMLGAWDDLYKKIIVSVAGGTPPDITRGKDFWFGDFASKGALLDLTDLINAQTTKYVAADKIMPQVWKGSQWKGHQVALPLHIFVRFMFCNQDLLDKAEVKPPTTWDEWTAAGQKITNKAANVWGTMLYNYTGTEDMVSHFQYMLHQAGGQYWDDANQKFAFNSPEGLRALQFQVDQIQKGACLPMGTSTNQVVESGRMGMWFGGSFSFFDLAHSAPKLKYTCTLFPKDKTSAGIIRSNNFYIFQASKHPQETFDYGAYFFQPDANRLYGEGEQYITPVLETQKDPYYQHDANWKVALAQTTLPDDAWQIFFPGYQESAIKFATELQNAYLGKKSPQQALTDGEAAATASLKGGQA